MKKLTHNVDYAQIELYVLNRITDVKEELRPTIKRDVCRGWQNGCLVCDTCAERFVCWTE